MASAQAVMHSDPDILGGTRLRSRLPQFQKARLVRLEDDTLLEAPPDAPPMTPENVRRMLEDWP